MRQYREKWVSGAFVQQTGTNVPSSFTGLNASSLANFQDLTLLNVASVARLNAASLVAFTGIASLADLTPSSFTGAAGWRGITVLNSGTAASSIQASAAQSGAVIHLQVYNYVPTTVESFTGFWVNSVGNGFFNVLAANSVAPVRSCPLAWHVIR